MRMITDRNGNTTRFTLPLSITMGFILCLKSGRGKVNGNFVIYNEIPVIFPNSFSLVNLGHEKEC